MRGHKTIKDRRGGSVLKKKKNTKIGYKYNHPVYKAYGYIEASSIYFSS